jgi:hypothetical protein
VEIKHGLMQLAETASFLGLEAGIVHCAISPETVFVAGGAWKLGGFNFAFTAQTVRSVDPTVAYLSYPSEDARADDLPLLPPLGYVAPELVTGGGHVTAAADVFSLAALAQVRLLPRQAFAPPAFNPEATGFGMYPLALIFLQNPSRNHNKTEPPPLGAGGRVRLYTVNLYPNPTAPLVPLYLKSRRSLTSLAQELLCGRALLPAANNLQRYHNLLDQVRVRRDRRLTIQALGGRGAVGLGLYRFTVLNNWGQCYPPKPTERASSL